MAGSDLPEGTANDAPTSVDFQQGVEDLANILGDPETDLNENEGEQQASYKAELDGEEPEGEADDEALDLEADPDSPDEADGPGEIKGGQFAPDTAKVTLEDGTVISIADLKRNNLFQRDYSRKTAELAEERRTFDAEKQSMQAQAQQVSERERLILAFWDKHMPQAPDPSMKEKDWIGYQDAKEQYSEFVAALNQIQAIQQWEAGQKQHEEAEQRQKFIESEAKKFFEAIPAMRDPARLEQFKSDTYRVLSERYGIPAELVRDVHHSGVLRAINDLIRFDNALKKAPKVKEQVQQKPKLISGGKRMDPKARTSREAQGRSEQLRKTGSFESGVASLMDLDL